MTSGPARRVVCFDCDSTLTTIEGIVWLAERAGAGPEIEDLTRRAMAGDVPLESVYARRLAAVRPDPEDLDALAGAYEDHLVEGARATVAALLAGGFEPWVVSGGLLEAVLPFAVRIGFARERVRAVPIPWEETDPWTAAATHPLARSDGKAGEIAGLAGGREVVLVGDGASDALARPAVHRLIGYGGVVHHAPMRAAADDWIRSPSLAPVVPLLLGPDPGPLAGTPHEAVWREGVALLAAGWARRGRQGGDGCGVSAPGPMIAP